MHGKLKTDKFECRCTLKRQPEIKSEGKLEEVKACLFQQFIKHGKKGQKSFLFIPVSFQRFEGDVVLRVWKKLNLQLIMFDRQKCVLLDFTHLTGWTGQ